VLDFHGGGKALPTQGGEPAASVAGHHFSNAGFGGCIDGIIGVWVWR